MSTVTNDAEVFWSCLNEPNEDETGNYDEVITHSRESAACLAAYPTAVSDPVESAVLTSLSNAASAVIALDCRITEPLSQQIQEMTALRQRVLDMTASGGLAASSLSAWGLGAGMAEYLDKRVALAAQAQDASELRQGLIELDCRARGILGGEGVCNTFASTAVLRDVRDMLIDYLEETAALLDEV